VKGIHDVITRAKFGDDRLRGSGVVAGQISAFPIDFPGRPYNTLTLPCERVIYKTVLLIVAGVDSLKNRRETLTARFFKRQCSTPPPITPTT